MITGLSYELIYRDKGGNEVFREKLNRKDGPPGPGRSLALTQKREVPLGQIFPPGPRVYGDLRNDEDYLTEEVLRDLSSQIHSSSN